MSTKGIYTALSGAMAQTLKLDTIANNIANVNTTAFKKDQQTFKEYLSALEKEAPVIQVPRVPASMDSFYQMQGADQSFVDSAGTYTNFEQGSLKSTGGKLDVAIDGEGFFEVLTPSGVKYTRNGHFTLNSEGQLVTSEGHQVLLEGETDPNAGLENFANRFINVNGISEVNISDNGEIFNGQDRIGKLSTVKFDQPEFLQKVGHNNYVLKETDENTQTPIAIQNPSLKQGFLETSNVNIVQEMTDMIMAQRVFEGTQKAITSFDSINDKLINHVGNTKG